MSGLLRAILSAFSGSDGRMGGNFAVTRLHGAAKQECADPKGGAA